MIKYTLHTKHRWTLKIPSFPSMDFGIARVLFSWLGKMKPP